MTILEHFKREVQYNQHHEQFAQLDDEFLGKRKPGCYKKEFVDEKRHLCINYVFDNGEHFVEDTMEKMLFYVNKIPDEYFIHKYIERIIYDFILENDIRDSSKNHLQIYCSENEISVPSFIRVLPYKNEKVVYLSEILFPSDLRGQGHGLKILNQIYSVCKRLGYRFILNLMVDRFYNSMVARGAKIITPYDAVEITDDTNLE